MMSMITMSFVVAKSTFAYLSIFALLGLGCAHDASTGVNGLASSNPFLVCGRVKSRQTSPGTNESQLDIGEFPWHANLYMEKSKSGKTEKKYRCGATIIQTNLVLTAANCVLDGFELIAVDPKKLFVTTGNVFRDYNSPHNNAASVRKSGVKNIYVNCQYVGIYGRWADNIALLELEEPFPFSDTLVPACLDLYGESKQILISRAYGKIAEFRDFHNDPSDVNTLQTLSVPYVPFNQCKTELINRGSTELFTKDKFCAGDSTGSGVPLGSTGSGLMFKRNDLWYLMGIHTSNFLESDGVERSTHALFTKVPLYTGWIQRVIFFLGRNESVPSCDRRHMDLKDLASQHAYFLQLVFGDDK